MFRLPHHHACLAIVALLLVNTPVLALFESEKGKLTGAETGAETGDGASNPKRGNPQKDVEKGETKPKMTVEQIRRLRAIRDIVRARQLAGGSLLDGTSLGGEDDASEFQALLDDLAKASPPPPTLHLKAPPEIPNPAVALAITPRLNATPGSPIQRPNPDQALIDALRESCRLLDQKANQLESSQSYIEADRHRETAAQVRLLARSLDPPPCGSPASQRLARQPPAPALPPSPPASVPPRYVPQPSPYRAPGPYSSPQTSPYLPYSDDVPYLAPPTPPRHYIIPYPPPIAPNDQVPNTKAPNTKAPIAPRREPPPAPALSPRVRDR